MGRPGFHPTVTRSRAAYAPPGLRLPVCLALPRTRSPVSPEGCGTCVGGPAGLGWRIPPALPRFEDPAGAAGPAGDHGRLAP